MEQRFLNTKEIAQYLSVAQSTIRSWVKVGKVPVHKFGRSVRFDKKKMDQWADEREIKRRRGYPLDAE